MNARAELASMLPPPPAPRAAIWLELDLEASGQEIRVGGRGSRGEHLAPRALPPEHSLDAALAFGSKVAKAARTGKPLDQAAIHEAQALHEQIFGGEIRDVVARLGEAAEGAPLLVRLFTGDHALASLPWEALCRPGTSEGFLGTDPHVLFARGVSSSDPWAPREVRGMVRVLAVAPGSGEQALAVLREALGSAIDVGEVEWLDPIAGADISARVLFDRLRRGKAPHVVHFLGHGGVDLSGRPVLRVADDEDGEEAWITVEALARELAASFSAELRLVVLEACEGAKPGAFGSAAEVLAKAGADAVVAHLWPVKADVARTFSAELYGTLTAADRPHGDVGAGVAAARRTLLTGGAEAFSPVLYLRGPSAVIFNFEGRRVAHPGPAPQRPRLAPALLALLEKPFTLVIGDLEDDHAALRQELTQFMKDNGDAPAEGLSLSALTQRCVLKFGQEVLYSLFQQAIMGSLATAPPPLVASLGRLAPPGVHVTLLWHPYLERAIAAHQPDRTIYAIQPAFASAGGKPRVVKRPAGAGAWKMEAGLPKRFDLDQEIVVLRLYGGYSAEPRPIFSHPLITEDDHISGLVTAEGLRLPTWMEELLGRPRIQPALFVQLSTLDFRHRMLLRWLYDQHPAPENSVALLAPGIDPSEPDIWDSGAGLPGSGHIAAILEDPAGLAALLDASRPEDGR